MLGVCFYYVSYWNTMITIDQFKDVEMRAGTISSAEKVEDTQKLMKLSVGMGEESPRQIVSGISEHFSAEKLVGMRCIVVSNLEPRQLRGIQSNGMIVAASYGDSLSLAHPGNAPDGTLLS